MSKAPRLINEPDELVDGFHRLHDHLLEARAPKLRLLPGWEKRTDEQKVQYMLKLAATMNHAAKLIQDERDMLVVLMEKKEQQLKRAAAAVRQNNEVLQSEVARMNEQRQQFQQRMTELTQKIEELQNGSVV